MNFLFLPLLFWFLFCGSIEAAPCNSSMTADSHRQMKQQYLWPFQESLRDLTQLAQHMRHQQERRLKPAAWRQWRERVGEMRDLISLAAQRVGQMQRDPDRWMQGAGLSPESSRNYEKSRANMQATAKITAESFLQMAASLDRAYHYKQLSLARLENLLAELGELQQLAQEATMRGHYYTN